MLGLRKTPAPQNFTAYRSVAGERHEKKSCLLDSVLYYLFIHFLICFVCDLLLMMLKVTIG